jgi:hypothetical protein
MDQPVERPSLTVNSRLVDKDLKLARLVKGLGSLI